ncbi:MAG: tRNA (adenosine(37)-N6)-threonylcarbamoyltransferase complex dimerization subunit type 1 TsaB, partial [Phycisphaerae bacterium]|nr:tRNA (adenosine(37)-N6)-threonylcarbamoyltransferase complex dimerization subunit type 1 TsaB [Phycisphaerae bacterium]
DDLLPAIARLFARHGLSARELDSIAISAGPGGYTALRIAMATAKMLSLATGAKCIPVPSARVAWFAMNSGTDGGTGGRLAVALSSKDATAFVTVFDGAATPVEAGRLMDAGDLAGLEAAALAADRFLPEAMRAAAAARGLEVRPLVLEAGACLAASVGLVAVAADELLPMYPREPEAVTKWRRLHSPRGGG